MSEKRRKFDQEFVRGLCGSSGRPENRSRRSLVISESTTARWATGMPRIAGEREGTSGLSVEDIDELKRLRSENAELRMERDVLKRSVVLWVLSRTRHCG
jgi:transposase